MNNEKKLIMKPKLRANDLKPILYVKSFLRLNFIITYF